MFDKLYDPFRQELDEVDRCIKILSESDFPLLQQVGLHIFEKKGKQLRPLLLLQTYHLFNNTINVEAYRSAALIEVLHTSSLVHDDVVDQADTRRGKPSVRALWGNRAAVLSGDYIISNAFLRAFPEGNSTLVMYMLEIIRTMCEGELMQLQYTASPSINEDIYFKIIAKKTAALFANCCRCGAFTAGASDLDVKKITEIGRLSGMAFQIKDDLLDIYPSSSDIEGKKYGNDLREGKITLPCLYYLNQLSSEERASFFDWIKHPEKWNDTELDTLLCKIRDSGAKQYCTAIMNDYAERAQNLFKETNLSKKEIPYTELLQWICL